MSSITEPHGQTRQKNINWQRDQNRKPTGRDRNKPRDLSALDVLAISNHPYSHSMSLGPVKKHRSIDKNNPFSKLFTCFEAVCIFAKHRTK